MPSAGLNNDRRAWHVALQQGRQRQQGALRLAEQLFRDTPRRAVHSHVGSVAQPLAP